MMKFNNRFLQRYLSYAPFSLASERSMECEILSHQLFKAPILDVGCGDGLFSFILFENNIDFGVDFNKKELIHASQIGKYKKLIETSATHMPFGNSSMETVLCNSVLEHIPDYRKVLDEIHRVLKNDGRVFISVPTDRFDKYTVVFKILTFFGLSSYSEKYRMFFNKFWKHYNFFSVEGWTKEFELRGLVVEKVIGYGGEKLCIFNDFMTIFSIPSLIIKKIINRWVIFPWLRKLYTYPIYFVFDNAIKRNINLKDNFGLALFELKKKS